MGRLPACAGLAFPLAGLTALAADPTAPTNRLTLALLVAVVWISHHFARIRRDSLLRLTECLFSRSG